MTPATETIEDRPEETPTADVPADGEDATREGQAAEDIATAEDAADATAADTALDTVEEPAVDEPAQASAPAPESPDVPIHRAICMADGCTCGATYRLTASGAGLMVLERYGMDLETALGLGPAGLPLCPKGHGEMTLADEQLPIEQAINQVNARTDAAKPRPLPFPAQPFNYEAVFHEIVQKRHAVAELERKHEEKKEAAKKAKAALDEANEQLGQMIEAYEERETERKFEIERRLRQAEEGHPEGTTLVRCVWEQQRPDPCPLCAAQTIEERNRVLRLLGTELLPRDAQGHLEQAEKYLGKRDVQDTIDALADVIADVPDLTVAMMAPEQRAAVRAWATATDRDVPRPAVLDTPHVASAVGDDAKVQTCATCGAVIKQLDTIAEAYPTGALVRLDCAAAEVEPSHRYPERKPKQPADRKRGVTKSPVAKTSATPKPTAAKSARRKK